MGRAGLMEIVRRLGALALAVAAVVAWSEARRWGIAATSLAGALAVYFAIPRPRIPQDAFGYEAMPAIYMPDLLAFVVGVPLFSLSFIVVASDPLLAGSWIGYVFFWVPAALSPAVFYISARHASSWLEILPDGVRIVRFGAAENISFAEVRSIAAEARTLPKWVSLLLVLFGGVRGASVAILHGPRARHVLIIERADGTRLTIPGDALPGVGTLIKAMKDAGVDLPPDLSHIAGKAERRPRRKRKARA